MNPWCDHCDPKYYVVYGFCDNCDRRCEPPLFDPYGEETLQDWYEMRLNWNKERGDLILDALRRTQNK